MSSSHRISLPLEKEVSNFLCKTEGKIPSWLQGTLLRNGPIPVTIDGKTNAHWFDGLAMLHAFAFANGKVTYTNKFLRSEAYKAVFEEGTLNYTGFASDPCRSLFKKLFSYFSSDHPLHNANIHIHRLADQFLAFTEIPLPVRFDPKTLETLGVFDYQDHLPKDRAWESAHAHYQPHREETFNYLVEYGMSPSYVIYKVEKNSSERKVVTKIPVKEPAYMHSFSVTENYIILTEYPFVVKPFDLLKGKPFITNFEWHPERGTRFLVIDRLLGDIVNEKVVHPFFAFHHANAFEEKGSIHVDIVTYDSPKIIQEVAHHFSSFSEENPLVRLERFTIKNGSITPHLLFEEKGELPRLNPFYDGLPYRYLYLTDARDQSGFPPIRPLFKIDTATKEFLKWSEEDCYPGEPIFVPSPDKRDEDDGLVLSVILDLKKQTSFLLLLDGKSFQEIGRVYAPHPIPAGLHGQFVC